MNRRVVYTRGGSPADVLTVRSRSRQRPSAARSSSAPRPSQYTLEISISSRPTQGTLRIQ